MRDKIFFRAGKVINYHVYKKSVNEISNYLLIGVLNNMKLKSTLEHAPSNLIIILKNEAHRTLYQNIK